MKYSCLGKVVQAQIAEIIGEGQRLPTCEELHQLWPRLAKEVGNGFYWFYRETTGKPSYADCCYEYGVDPICTLPKDGLANLILVAK
jgi:hypothetical protein